MQGLRRYGSYAAFFAFFARLLARRLRPVVGETFVRCSTWALVAAVVCLWVPSPAVAERIFDWKGDTNNNWQDPTNWDQFPGAGDVPDDPDDYVQFTADAQRFNVDLNDNIRSVGEFRIYGATPYRFFNGRIRNFQESTLYVHNGSSAVFDVDLIFEQVNSGNWNLFGSLVIDGQLTGSGNITLTHPGTLTLNAANPYSGTLTTLNDAIVIGHTNALQNSTVVASVSDRFTFNVSAANFGALSGSGDIQIGSTALTAGGNGASTTYSGALTGNSGVGPKLIHNGTGTFTLTGSISSVNNVQALNGLVVFDGASVSLNDPNLTGGLILNGGDVSVTNGASVSIESTSASGGAAVINGQTLTIDGGHLSAPRIPSGASGVVDLVSDPADGSALTIGMVSGFDVNSTFSGTLTGTGSFNKVGAGSLTLAQASTFSGNAIVDGGAVVLGNVNSLQDATVTLNADDGLDLNGLNPTIGAIAGAGNLDIGSATISVGKSNTDTTYSGQFSGTQSVQKIGAGAWTLTNTHPSFTGTIDVNGGSILVGSVLALQDNTVNINVNDGLDVNGLNATLGAVGGTGDFDFGSTTFAVGNNDLSTAYSGSIAGDGTLNKIGAGDWTLSGANTGLSGTVNIDAGSIVLGRSNALGNAIVNINVDDGLDLNGLDASIGAVAGAGDLNIGSTFSNFGARGDSLYSGDITGNADAVLNKAGTGTWTLTGASSGFGDFDVLFGTVVVDGGSVATVSNNTLQNIQAALIVRNGGAFDFGGNSTSISGSLLTESGGSYAGDDIDTFGSWGVTVQDGGMLTADHVELSAFTSGGNGAFMVTGNSSVANISSLTMGAAGLSSSSSTEVRTGAALNVTGDTNFKHNGHLLTVDGGRFVTNRLLNSAGVVPSVALSDPVGNAALTVGTNNGSSTFDGLISDAAGGPGGITKVGTGTLTLTNANTFTGDTHVNGGQVILGNTLALQHSTVNINVNDGLNVNGLSGMIGGLAGSGDLDLGSTMLTTGGNGASTAYSGAMTGTIDAQLIHNGPGTLTLSGAGSDLGSIRAQNGAIVFDAASVNLTSTGSGPTTGALLANTGTIAIRNGSQVQYNAPGQFAVIANGSMTVDGSTLTGRQLNVAAYGSSTGSVLAEDSAVLDITSAMSFGSTGDGDLTVQTGAQASAGTINLGLNPGAAGNVFVTGGGSALSANVLSLGGGSGGGFTGGAGAVRVDSGATATIHSNTLFWTDTSSLHVNGGVFSTDQLTNDTGISASIQISDPAGNSALTVGSGNGSSTFDGTIADAAGGPGSLRKVGTGTFELTGNSSYSGGTIIDGGLLLANNAAGSAAGSGSVQVNSGGALGGNGNISGTVTVAPGGTLAPGASSGMLPLGSDLNLQSGSALNIELGGATPGVEHDQVAVTGTATLGGTLDLSYINDFTATPGQPFVILTAGTLTGTFDAVNFPDGQAWFIDYDTGANTVTVGVEHCLGDLDGDLDVDLSDLATILVNYSTPSGASPEDGDLDGDGDVDLSDLAALLSVYGTSCL